MLTPTPGERVTERPAVVLLFFCLVTLISELGKAAVYAAVTSLLPHPLTSEAGILIQLFSTAVTVLVVLLYCLLIEKRSLLSLGLTRQGMLTEYATGLIGGLLLFGSAVLLCVCTGALTVSASASKFSPGLWASFLIGFLLQGASEELLCRAYLMVSLSRGMPLWGCAVTNAMLFALLHIGNPGISVIALVNIFLFGLFASMLTVRRGSIWMISSLHGIWNFAQGNLFGIPVSGIAGIPSPLLSTLHRGSGQALIHGGAFGLEGGLAVTVVLGVACGIAWSLPTKQSEAVS